MVGLIMKMIKEWHRICYRFNQILFNDCIDAEEKMKLKRKIDYHKQKFES